MEYCDGGYEIRSLSLLVLFFPSFSPPSFLCLPLLTTSRSVLDVMQVTDAALTEPQIGSICYHILKGLSYMHAHKILHRDIKVYLYLLLFLLSPLPPTLPPSLSPTLPPSLLPFSQSMSTILTCFFSLFLFFFFFIGRECFNYSRRKSKIR